MGSPVYFIQSQSIGISYRKQDDFPTVRDMLTSPLDELKHVLAPKDYQVVEEIRSILDYIKSLFDELPSNQFDRPKEQEYSALIKELSQCDLDEVLEHVKVSRSFYLQEAPDDIPQKKQIQERFQAHFKQTTESSTNLLKGGGSFEDLMSIVPQMSRVMAEDCFRTNPELHGTLRQDARWTPINDNFSKEYETRLRALIPAGSRIVEDPLPEFSPDMAGVEGREIFGTIGGQKIHLATYLVAHRYIPKLENESVFGRNPASYPRVAIIHKHEARDVIMQYVCAQAKEVLQKPLTRKEQMRNIATIIWWMSYGMFWCRASATIMEISVSAAAETKKIPFSLDKLKKQGRRLDMESYATPNLEEFIEILPSLVSEDGQV